MPLVPLQTISVHDFLALGKDKINENFASIASFVDFLEGEAHQERNSTIDVVQGLHGFSVGDAVRFDSGAGRFVRSTADTPDNAEVMGVVSHYTDASHFKLTLTGLLHDLGFTFEPGTVYYLQDDGSLGDTPGTVSRAVLGALPPETSGAPVRGVILNESSISSMSALRDVDLTGLTDNNTLVYSGGVWKAQNLDFDSIIGVDGNPVEGDVLIFTGGVWKPTQPTSGGDMYSAVYDPQRSGTVNQARVAETVEWGNILSKPTTFPPSSHIHTVADITGLSQQLGNKANLTHVHPNATTSVSGFLSAQDKTKLDSFTANGSGYARLSEPNTFSSIQTMLSQTLLQNGAPAAPALSFTSETDMGIYRAGTGSLALSVGGTSRIRVTSTLATMDVNLNVTGNYARANTPTTGALDNRDLINRGWFNSNYLKTGDVTNDSLADGAVTSGKLANTAVTTAKLANLAVTTDKIALSAVTNDRLANGIDASKLTTGTLPIDRLPIGANNVSTVAPGQATTGAGDNRHPVGSVRFVVRSFPAIIVYGSAFSDALIARSVIVDGHLKFEPNPGVPLPGVWQALSSTGTVPNGYGSSLPVLAVRVS